MNAMETRQPTDLELLAEAHYRFLALWPGYMREEWAGASFIANTLISVPFRNHVALVRSQPDDVITLIERANTFYHDLNALPAFQLDGGTTPANLPEALLQAGYSKQNEEVWMLCPLTETEASTAPVPSHVTIEQLTPASSPALIQAYIDSFNISFRVPPHVHAGFDASFRGLLPNPAGLHFVGLIEGEPAGALSLLHDHQLGGVYNATRMTGGVYNVGTFPAFRGRGVATALLLHLLNVARQVGLKQLLLQTLHHGPAQPIYERVGFRTHFVRHWYLSDAPRGIWSE